MSESFIKDLAVYQANVTEEMLMALAESLELPTSICGYFRSLGIGYIPHQGVWTLPERNAQAKLTGLGLRQHHTGNKWMVRGGKRGFIYIPGIFNGKSPSVNSAKREMQRVTKDLSCPICGRFNDGCLVDLDGVGEPISAICVRTEAGSARKAGNAGYLHIIQPQQRATSKNKNPILIVEGFSDWAAATVLGFPTIAKPCATFKVAELIPLLFNKSIVIIGDNDPAGQKGLIETFETIQQACKIVKRITPPEGIKDLREWYVRENLTTEKLLKEIETGGTSTLITGVIGNNAPLTVAKAWLEKIYSDNGIATVRNYKGLWTQYDSGIYKECNMDEFRGSLYRFLDGQTYIKSTRNGEQETKEFRPDRSLIGNVIDALNFRCVVSDDPPCWLDGNGMDTSKLIVFKNGILNVEEYSNSDKIELIEPTPMFFTMMALPHNFSAAAQCNYILEIIYNILSDDKEKIQLLQEWFGYMLLPDQRFEKMMLFVGRPRSGKGTILEIMTAMLGKEQVASTNFANLCSAFGYQPLIGKLAAILPDASIPRNIDATTALEKIKHITGGDSVSVDRKFLAALPNIKLKCRFTIAVNTLPELPDHARALEPRLNIINFEESYIGREDRNLKHRLTSDESQLEGLVIWALEGLRRLYEKSEFTAPKSSKPLYREFRALTTPVSEFVEECCTLGVDEQVDRQQLFDCWRGWVQENGLKPGPRSQLGQRLISLYPYVISQVLRVNNRELRVYTGIGLTDNALKRYLNKN